MHNTYHNSIFLYNVHSYMFRHLYFILREFYICASLSSVKFLKFKLLKLQFLKTIKLY